MNHGGSIEKTSPKLRVAHSGNSVFVATGPQFDVGGRAARASSGGCTRNFFRKQADEEVSEVLAQKDKYPDWAIENWHVYPDPRARFADTDNPDFPPKPPDDPASYAMAPNPQKPGKAGVARSEGTGYLDLIAKWDKENRERRAKE